ncbi:branched-chain amino acid ABC transporter permease [Xanthobacter agilis]|uniref:branched-chain amino acid ABC transporter permease n=1 Tax=Xanthobacter agilis TaxID=47492 RepID=UPI003727DF05
MNAQIALLLGQDGFINGAIYALLALSILMVFSVTRILLIPLGEFVSYAALTMASMQAGKPVMLGAMLVALCLIGLLMDARDALRAGRRLRFRASKLLMPAYVAAVTGLSVTLPLEHIGMAFQGALTVALVVPLGPLLYRVLFLPIASANGLVLLIVAIAAHVALTSAGLLIFGPEGSRTEPFSDATFTIGDAIINSQTLWVIALSFILIALLYAFFEKNLYGKALRATAVDRLGAQLVGISPALAGKASFALAAFISGLSGVLIAPITTIYFDSGFVISLKGFVGAIIGGLASYPVAAAGAVALGLVEAFSTFYASSYKEVIVFTLLLPVLLWRSVAQKGVKDEQ